MKVNLLLYVISCIYFCAGIYVYKMVYEYCALRKVPEKVQNIRPHALFCQKSLVHEMWFHSISYLFKIFVSALMDTEVDDHSYMI
jgi:hypothetical protein